MPLKVKNDHDDFCYNSTQKLSEPFWRFKYTEYIITDTKSWKVYHNAKNIVGYSPKTDVWFIHPCSHGIGFQLDKYSLSKWKSLIFDFVYKLKSII